MSGARHIGQHGGQHIDADDLALYALQVLEAEEAAAIGEHLRGCAECRSGAAALRGDLAALAVTSELQAPPAKAKQRLFQQMAREKKRAAAVVPAQAAAVDSPVAPSQAASRDAEPAGFGEQPVRRDAGAPGGRAAGAFLAEDGVSPLDAAFEAAPDTYRGEERKAAEEDEFRRRRKVPGALRVLPWLGWAVAAGMAGVAGDFYYQRGHMQANLVAESGRMADLAAQAAKGEALMEALTDRAAVRVALTVSPPQTAGQSHGPARPPEPPLPSGHAAYLPDQGTLLFTASNLEPLPQYKTYELWLIPADGRDPIPAGMFQPDARGNASVILPRLPKGVVAKAFGVTIEEVGGAEQPTLPILLAGAAG
jgi:anti-sigma-K factor RskA